MLTTAVFTNLARPDLLTQTLKSLAGAGLEDVLLHVDAGGAGHARAYLGALQAGLGAASPDGWLLLCEDDIAVPRGLGAYLQETILPALETYRAAPRTERLGFASLYCSAGYRAWVRAHQADTGVPGFGRLIPNDAFAGTQAILFPRDALAAVLDDLDATTGDRLDWYGDRVLGDVIGRAGLAAWCHTPSLVDHRGLLHTTLDSKPDNEALWAADYVGDEWTMDGMDAMDTMDRNTST